MNKEVNDALHTLLNLSLKDKSFSTQKQQFKIVYDYITNLQEENERLNNIIDVKSAFIQDLLEIIYYSDDNIIHTKAHLLGQDYEDKLKELKEGNNENNNKENN